MSWPTTLFAAGYLARPDGKPRRSDIPVIVINPSCEQLQLAQDPSGAWRNATVEAFTGLGLARADGHPPPAVRDMEAEIDGDHLIVTVTGYIPHAPDHEFALKPPQHVLDQVRRMEGIAVSIITKVVPSILTPEELPTAFHDEEAVTGWIPLHGRQLTTRIRRAHEQQRHPVRDGFEHPCAGTECCPQRFDHAGQQVRGKQAGPQKSCRLTFARGLGRPAACHRQAARTHLVLSSRSDRSSEGN